MGNIGNIVRVVQYEKLDATVAPVETAPVVAPVVLVKQNVPVNA